MTLKTFLFKNEAVHGIKTPSDYLYIKILRFMLLVIGSWPRKEIGEPEPYYQEVFFKLFYLAVTTGCFAGAVTYIIIHNSELTFLETGHMYIIILMSIVDLSRVVTLTCSSKYRAVGKEFLTKIHLFFFKDRSKYAMKTHKMVHLLSHLFTLCLLTQMLFGLSLFNLIPMYNNYAAGRYKSVRLDNSTFEHSLYYYYPFNTSTEMRGYVIACIFHWIISYLCSTWFCMFDLFLSIMVFHLWGHFKILINLLNDFPKPSTSSSFTTDNGYFIRVEKYSQEELRQVSERLAECIIYHRQIVKFTNTMSDVFGPMLFIYYLFHQTSGCLLLLECSQMTTPALMRYLPLTIILTQQLIQLSVIFELVGSESDKLKHAVYGVPWEAMDSKNRKVVAFFLMNVQEPVHVKALGVADVGVTSMAMILKTSVSYFTFLRSV
uniref:Odorant receptor n=1 Tax=Mythimna loreyi TaxID=667449 RepID=A0AAU6NDM3_9NEOP